MSWRTVVIQNRAKLDLELGSMVVRGETTTKIHLSEISVVLIENTAVALTAALVCELSKRKIKLIFCDEKRSPICEAVPYYGCHDTSRKVKEQINWNSDFKIKIWTAIVQEKIIKQAEHLNKYSKEETRQLAKYLEEIELDDKTNREGHAAKVYFNALFGLKFTRDSDTPINAALNYGYSILLSAFNREIVSSGYLTQLGISHENMFNFYNLSCDLMEPFRPLVDEIVYNMEIKEFTTENKRQLIEVLNKEIIIEGKNQFVNNAIKIYSDSVFAAINSGDAHMIQFYKNKNEL